jgi:hypothetical protein
MAFGSIGVLAQSSAQAAWNWFVPATRWTPPLPEAFVNGEAVIAKEGEQKAAKESTRKSLGSRERTMLV